MKRIEDTPAVALKYAYRLLAKRDRSVKELRGKLLERGFSGETTDLAVKRLEDDGYLNDRRTAEAFKRYALNNKHLGRFGVRSFMLKRGIDEDIADELSGRNEDYIETAKAFTEKKMKLLKKCDIDTKRRRIYGLLARRGFDSETINSIIKSL
ncbi:MAG: regulatory protein RecX [Nitrospirae bacterium]|nr:MAG: regulatory protein RecX [Nitrospirota bacterium]